MAGIFGAPVIDESDDIDADDLDELEDADLDGAEEDEEGSEEEDGEYPDEDGGTTSQANPVETRAQEAAAGGGTGTPLLPVKASHQLVCIFDENGRVRVARAKNGQRLEEWRAPNQEEWMQLRQRGRFVQGGIMQPAVGESPAPQGWSMTKKVLVGVAAAGVIAAGGYWLYKKSKETDED